MLLRVLIPLLSVIVAAAACAPAHSPPPAPQAASLQTAAALARALRTDTLPLVIVVDGIVRANDRWLDSLPPDEVISIGAAPSTACERASGCRVLVVTTCQEWARRLRAHRPAPVCPWRLPEDRTQG